MLFEMQLLIWRFQRKRQPVAKNLSDIEVENFGIAYKSFAFWQQ